MAEIEGMVRVYESSDGGEGDPAKTTWQFFVDNKAVITTNRDMAETMRFAVLTYRLVRVTYDDQKNNTISQVRLEFFEKKPPEPEVRAKRGRGK